MSLQPCASAHCSGIQGNVNEICKATGWGVSHPVIVQAPDGSICYCSCSCLAFGTPVLTETGERSVEDILVGEHAIAAGLDLIWNPVQVQFSAGTTGASKQKNTVLITYLETAIAVTSDHVFLMSDKTLRRADRLAPGDALVGAKGENVIIKSIHIGDYFAGFHHIATTIEEPPADLKGHLILTNGVVSGDYAVQLYARDGSLSSAFSAEHDELPVIGSPKYIERHGPGSREAPSGDPVVLRSGRRQMNVAKNLAVEAFSDAFVPANATTSDIPSDAASFISDEEAEEKAKEPSRSWNDPMSRQWTQYVLDLHKAFYPSISFQLDWADDTVNAYAWVQNGQRFVAIKGGLVRHVALSMEGISLVIAHEIGHHYGGPPTFPSGLSCEGQADYSGVRDIMRKVWFGATYADTALAGIAQMAAFFGVPNNPGSPGGSAGCSHPAGACRIATYYSALRLTGKPACAS